MGTRHLISIYLDGEAKLAQYGQWDGYPSGQGFQCVAFLQAVDLDVFKTQVRNSRMLTEQEVRERWTEAGANPESEMVGLEIAEQFNRANPQLSRDSGAGTLTYIMEAEKPELAGDSTPFAGDSLFCEWAYVIDLDEMTFEVYEGFQKKAHEQGRFWDLPYTPSEDGEPREYWPMKLVASWAIQEIPSNWLAVVEGGPMEVLAASHSPGGRV